MDERVALTSANNSGAAGAGSIYCLGAGAESLAQLAQGFPHWLGQTVVEPARQGVLPPCDMHFLKALVAPRALLCTEAMGDIWANPSGTWQTHVAAKEAYQFLGHADRIAVHYRAGEHEHLYEDWQLLIDFADAQFRGLPMPVLRDFYTAFDSAIG